jgi:serine/threonine protein phosphatase PrpC/tetratricopeptide (TPR) repeat protein
MRKENSSFKTKFISEPGSYLRNLDYFAFVELEDYACYCIADGIDDDLKRESAKIAVSAVISAFNENPGCSQSLLKKYMNIAHSELHRESAEARLEASIIILVTDYKKAVWASAGNTRLFLIRNGNIKCKTKDTSLSQNMIDNGEIPLDQLAYHEERHNLYTYLGQAGHLKAVISQKRKLEDGDIFVLYTRGVWECVGTPELLDALDDVSDPEKVCTGLEEVILSQQQDIVENYTIVSIFVDKIYRNPKANKIKKYTKIGLAIAFVILMILVMLAFATYRKNKSTIASMAKYKERGVEFVVEENYTSASEQFTQDYTLSDNVKAGKKSKAHKEVDLVKIYYKMSSYLNEAETSLTDGEYKKAANKYQSAVDKANELTEYKENIDFIKDIESYRDFANAMKQGSETLETGDFEAAKNFFVTAQSIADAMDATAKKENAESKLKDTNAKISLLEAAQFEADGEAAMNDGQYQKALNQFESARKMYELAKDSYGYADADSKISMVDIKIENASSAVNKQTNEQLESEADSYVQAANEALKNNQYTKAKENYQMAKDIYKNTGNSEQVSKMDEKMDAAENGPDSANAEQALADVLSAAECMARGDLPSAVSFYTSAQKAYDELSMTSEASRLQNIITQLGGQVAPAQ